MAELLPGFFAAADWTRDAAAVVILPPLWPFPPDFDMTHFLSVPRPLLRDTPTGLSAHPDRFPLKKLQSR
ncbi:hypothetical protein IFM12275_68920 (plasmid) [Nocardia sputorum]|nr:hypothetical protein IFM12275_68920 [Nocardia sputorum]